MATSVKGNPKPMQKKPNMLNDFFRGEYIRVDGEIFSITICKATPEHMPTTVKIHHYIDKGEPQELSVYLIASEDIDILMNDAKEKIDAIKLI